MKKLYSLFLFILIMGMMMLTHSCSSDDLTAGIAQQEETKGWHTAKVKFGIQCSTFDAQRDARAESLTWKEGDVVWILLTDKDGKKVQAYVQYSSGTWGEIHWEGYKSQLTCEVPRTAEAYFMEGVNNPNQLQVSIDACKAIYACTTGTYQYPDGGDMIVNVALSPTTGRIRFTGSEGMEAKVSGIRTYKSFNPATGQFTSSTDAIATTVGSTGSTPYLYAIFASAETPTLIVKTDKTFKTQFEATTPVLQVGKSGYLSLPTVSDHRGWVTTTIPVTGVQLDKTELALEPGQTSMLTATILPEDAKEKGIEWTSSNPDVATVSNGMVTAKAVGTATITAISVEDNSKQASCKVTVSTDRVYTVNGVSFTMVYVEPGTFQMGSDTGYSDEEPVHSVTISKGYYIGETEVTQALWKAVTVNSPTTSGSSWSTTYGLGDNYPAYYISYEDVQSFITKLNSLTGAQFRMPTEAEWEFAARGGNKSKGYEYSGSNTVGDVAWYKDNSGSKTHAVKTKAANELGIYDMSGNVWEWCSDRYGSYSGSSVTDPIGPASGSYRVGRGGSWSFSATLCRSASRNTYAPTYRCDYLGVRLACSAVLQ